MSRQPMPTVFRMNEPLPSGDDEVYAYSHHEIFFEEEFVQTRSGPNWLGNIMTLTTCKQRLRTFKADPRDWLGVWLVGFTPKSAGDNYLLYVARIGWVFPSNYDLRRWLTPENVKAKSADTHPCGDIYTPKRELSGDERWDHRNFVEPENHTRSTEFYSDGTPKWWKDIDYTGVADRYPTVFAFEPSQTFIWTKPRYVPTFVPGRSNRRFDSLEEFNTEVKQCR